MPSKSNGDRWTLYPRAIGMTERGNTIYGEGALAKGPQVLGGSTVEVMPVSEHRENCDQTRAVRRRIDLG